MSHPRQTILPNPDHVPSSPSLGDDGAVLVAHDVDGPIRDAPSLEQLQRLQRLRSMSNEDLVALIQQREHEAAAAQLNVERLIRDVHARQQTESTLRTVVQ